MEAREAKGLQIARSNRIEAKDGVWIVPSQSKSKKYTVRLNPLECTCPDFETRGLPCKHVHAVLQFILHQETGEPIPAPEPIQRPTYKQAWREYTAAQVNGKSKFLELLFALCEHIEEPVQHMGRPRISLADRTFATIFKVYECLSGRRFMSDLREAKQRGLLSDMPHFNSISRYIESEELTPVLKQLIIESALPLKAIEQDFAVDSSGFSKGQTAGWFREKYTNKADVKMIDWLKVHIMCGVSTHVVTSVEVSGRDDHDYKFFQPLVEATAQNFKMREVSADKGYIGLSNLRLVVDNGAQPFIPFKSHTTDGFRRRDKTGLWKRLFHFFKYNQDEFARHYHKRSNVETAFSMIKRKFGERLRTKTDVAQLNEVLCKILCHNLCCVIQSMYELGVEPTFGSETSFDSNVV
jgi:transposase